jgi:hypothetical protein
MDWNLIRKAIITDISKVVSILSSFYTEDELQGVYLYLRMRMKDEHHFFILIDESNQMCLFVERIGNFKCQFHIYSTEEGRGSVILNFFKECAEYIFSNTSYKALITYITQRHASIFARKVGFLPGGIIEGSGNRGEDEEIFIGTKENIMKRLNIGGM